MNQALEVFFAPCPRGLEAVLGQELEWLGATHLQPTAGGVGFQGSFSLCYRVNLESRIASRVLWQVFSGSYSTEQDVYLAAVNLSWIDWFSVTRKIKVNVTARQCSLKSLDFVTLRIKDAVCDSFTARGKARPDVDTRVPDIQIVAFLDQGMLKLYLDTSGEPLFKRGWRGATGRAPLRENLSAGIVQLSGWTKDQVLLDPMCGSGTILIEAAHMAKGRAPGLGRTFAFQHLSHFDEKLWANIQEASRGEQKRVMPGTLWGCDREEKVLRIARENLQRAGLEDDVVLEQADIVDLTPPVREGVIVTNPPYGVRTSTSADVARLYPAVGHVLKRKFFGWRAYVFTADTRLPKLIRLAPSRKTPLFNGALECRLYEFHMVRGGNRTHSQRAGC